MLANCMTQRQRREGKARLKRAREEEGWRETENVREMMAAKEKGTQNRMNLTHHDALNILNNCLLNPSDSDLYCTKERKNHNILNSPSR